MTPRHPGERTRWLRYFQEEETRLACLGAADSEYCREIADWRLVNERPDPPVKGTPNPIRNPRS